MMVNKVNEVSVMVDRRLKPRQKDDYEAQSAQRAAFYKAALGNELSIGGVVKAMRKLSRLTQEGVVSENGK